ncbi:hypothetical protein [Mycetocola saprophilus]|uniref:hypothetical protein n=1 Tax=Mycetocola saprophilus TaxID=76636 RepID=UPI003BF0C0B6
MSDVQKLIAEAVKTARGLLDFERGEFDPDVEDAWFQSAKLLTSLATALEAATSPVEPEGDVVERVARHLANLDEGESWPGNSELGGSLTGTRDDEYRAAMQDEAREILALAGVSRPVGGETVTEAFEGRIVTLQFEDGVERGPYCGLEDCECPDHGYGPPPAGHYVTIRLDGEPRMSLGRATVLVSPEQDGGKA